MKPNLHARFAGAHITHHANRQRAGAVGYPTALRRHFGLRAHRDALAEISKWPNYQPTPLHTLDDMAREFDLGAIHYKDESPRFGLGSFKALGGSYAVLRVLQQHLAAHGERVSVRRLADGALRESAAALAAAFTVVTATDGNHGRAVAWGAARFGCRCRIYIHAAVSERRADAMRELGAEVIRVRGNYDDSVRQAATDAATNGWQVVSDTSYADYLAVPGFVMAGYSVMVAEAVAALTTAPTHVFVQGGVGGLAAAVAAHLWRHYGAARARFIVVEPAFADCLLQSARRGRITAVAITRETIMAGLSCGEVSELAWRVLARGADDFLAIDDELVAPMMRALARRQSGIEAGESAVAGLAGCLAACAQPALREALALRNDSRVLVFGTEGATDREIYESLVNPAAEAP